MSLFVLCLMILFSIVIILCHCFDWNSFLRFDSYLAIVTNAAGFRHTYTDYEKTKLKIFEILTSASFQGH